jgi:uncharacterized membrane protein (Fun14 family)
MIHEETTEFSWDTLEYEHREKSTDWYWALGILIVIGAVISFITKNFLFGVLLLIGGFLLGLFAGKKNPPISVEISQQGILINDDLIGFNTVTAFWIYRNAFGIRKLILKTTRNFAPIVSIPIPDDVRAIELRTFLLEIIPEIEMTEAAIDLIMERIGF